LESHVTLISDEAAGRPDIELSTTIVSVSKSTCSALLRLTSFCFGAFCASSADVPMLMVNATQRAPMPLIFFMPLSRCESACAKAAADKRRRNGTAD